MQKSSPSPRSPKKPLHPSYISTPTCLLRAAVSLPQVPACTERAATFQVVLHQAPCAKVSSAAHAPKHSPINGLKFTSPLSTKWWLRWWRIQTRIWCQSWPWSLSSFSSWPIVFRTSIGKKLIPFSTKIFQGDPLETRSAPQFVSPNLNTSSTPRSKWTTVAIMVGAILWMKSRLSSCTSCLV